MIIIIKNKKIQYHWEDRIERQLNEKAVDHIRNALNNKYIKGSFEQNGCVCKWQDVTDNDILMFGMTQGWFD